jgi:hypothetical protein
MMDCKKRNMKAFIFTLDAVFALVVASAGISILLYGTLANQSTYTSSPTQAYGLMQGMLQTSVVSASGSSYIGSLVPYQNVSTSSWPQYGHDAQLSSGVGAALQTPYLLYAYTAPANILPSVVVDGGFVYAAAGNKIYMINATTGALRSSLPAGNGASVVGVPAIYKSILLFANASNYVRGINVYNSVEQWNFSTGPGNTVITPLEIENNYLAFGTTNGFYLLNPVNGTLVAYANMLAPARAPAYANGEYLVSTDFPSSQNRLYSYVFAGNALSSVWNVPLTSLPTTSPSVLANTVGVGSGNSIYILTIGGSMVAISAGLGSTALGVSAYKGGYYVQTATGLYNFATNGNMISSQPTPATLQNSTASESQSDVYVVAGGDFRGYGNMLGRLLWNVSLQGNYLPGYSSVALAYGNAYIPDGNVLYAFGAYKPQPNDNMLQTLASMYLNGQGGYANYLLGSVYNSSNAGIFINRSYAPDLETAQFNGVNSYISTGTAGLPLGSSPRSVFAWVYPTAIGTNVIFCYGTIAPQELSQLAMIGGYPRFGIDGYGVTGNYIMSPNQWYFVGYTYAGSNGIVTVYLNGQSTSGSLGALASTVLSATDPSNIGEQSSNNGYFWPGSIADVQVYNISLSQQQVMQLYQGGAFGMPVNTKNLKLWMPLDGNPSDLSGATNTGAPYGISYSASNYAPPRLLNAYQVSRASIPLALTANGVSRIYNVSVVTWH